MRVNDLLAFIVERHNVHRRKRRGQAKPWTAERILQSYRFCNCYRELDKETLWIAENWREPHCGDPDLWFALVVARLVNWHPSLDEIGYPVPWQPQRFVQLLNDRQRRGELVFNSAYRVGTNGVSMPKIPYLAHKVLTPLWCSRRTLRCIARGTLGQGCAALMEHCGLGSFIAGQVLADLKYVGPLRGATDWWTWATSGPGSRRGLNRVLGRDKDKRWSECEWLQHLQALRAEIKPLMRKLMPPMHAQDLQDCLCEFDKYERARLGQGRPKRKYAGLPA